MIRLVSARLSLPRPRIWGLWDPSGILQQTQD